MPEQKQDDEEQSGKDKKDKDKDKDKDKSGSSGKSVNSHIVVPTTATITEIADDDEEIRVSLYSAVQSRWMVNSGATHHITLHRSNFATYKQAPGVVSLGGHAEIKQIGTGSVIVKLISSISGTERGEVRGVFWTDSGPCHVTHARLFIRRTDDSQAD